MIVKMSKVTILCTREARDESLSALQNLGVLHVQHFRMPGGEMLDEERARLQHVRHALDVLPKAPCSRPSGRRVEEAVEEIWGALHRRKVAEEKIEDLERERQRIKPFGSFDPRAIARLREHGLFVKLYLARKEHVPEPPADAVRVVLAEESGTVYFAVIARRDVELAAIEVRLPEKSLAEIEADLESARKTLEECREILERCACEREVIARKVADLEETVEYLETREGMAMAEPVVMLQGFCPERKLDALRKAARRYGWGLVIREPSPDDRVPTELDVVWWARPIQFLYDTLGILPGYDEVDISPVFLAFFSIFFGMLVGDAGYGLLFLVATIALRKKMPKPLVGLLAITSIATFAWGALTGAWFSVASLPAPLAALRVDWLTDNNNVMELCFLIGAVHLTIAHLWRAWLLRRTSQALAHLGWAALTWAMFFLARFLILQRPLVPATKLLLALGITAVALFMTPVSKLKQEWFGHAMLPLNIISNFGDVVSYVRLFAVGAATLAVGQAFNQMLSALVTGFLSGLLAATVLFAMHALNIGMAILGVMVHGVRLNALEFSQHMDISWKGFRYRPFARRAGAGAEGPAVLSEDVQT
jgi:V/A-type H+-transporting ATPase subunit I